MEFNARRQPLPPGTGRLLIKTLLVMKLTVILVAVTCLQVNAKGYAQTITFSLKNVQLETAFKEIEKQTGYNFFYGDVDLQKARTVNLEVKEASLEKVLQLCLNNQPITYSIVDKVIILRSKDPKKDARPVLPIDVKGKVTNEKGESLAGATISVKGTNKLTTTNENGDFFLAGVEENAVLLISHVSFETQELKITGRSELAIQLKVKINELSDIAVIVNTGYQQIPKERATGSFEFINNEELNRRVGADILSRLEGVSNSVLFDRRKLAANQNTIDASNIFIRGLSTLTETIKAPLVVVNNFPYDGDINNINPNDVESITILKDAAAASIWGARAGNGVIVITTKQGKFNQPTRLSINMNVNIVEKPDLFYYPQMSISDYIGVEAFLFGKGFYNSSIINTTTRPALTPAVEIFVKRREGMISAADSTMQIDALRNMDVRNDFDKYLYQTSINQQYAINLTGGTEKINYSFSGGFDNNMPNLADNKTQRTTLRSATTLTPVKNLEIQLGIAFTDANTKNNNEGGIGSPAYTFKSGRRLYPYARLVDANGNALALPHDYRTTYIDTAGGGMLLDWNYRPLDEMRFADNTAKLQDIVLNIGANYRFTDFLSANVYYQYEKTTGQTKNYRSNETYYTRNLINLFSQINGNAVTYIVPNQGILDETFSELISHQARGQLNFNKTWNGKHRVSALAGSEIKEARTNLTQSRTYGFNKETFSSSYVDYVSFYPQYGNLNGGFAQIPNQEFRQEFLNRFVSLFGNAAYTYDNRYTFSASIRKDAANLFGVNINDKWSPFWSLGGAWNISNESFYKLNTISYLRLRATYGYQGNVNNTISPYTIISLNDASGSLINQPFASISIPANPDLSWERIGQLNIGIDFRMLHDRISGTIEAYRKNSTDLIFAKELDRTTGIVAVKANSADMVGKGIDINLNTINIKGKFSWQSALSFNYVTNKVTKYFLDDSRRGGVRGIVANGGLSLYAVKDKNPYGVYSYPFAGLDAAGNPQGYIAKQLSTDYFGIINQSLDTANVIYHGPGLAPFFGFFTNSLSYKGLFLTASISYRFGYYFRKSSINYFTLYRTGVTHPDYAKRWQNPGDEAFTNVPSMIYPVSNPNRDDFYAGSSVNVLRGDNVRLEYIRLSYDIDKSLLKKLPVQKIRFYVNVSNIGIIWRANKERLDPDYNTGNALFPLSKSIAMGLTIDF